jgi:hypothetical protein
MKPLLEAIKAKYLCLHDWEVLHKNRICNLLGNTFEM